MEPSSVTDGEVSEGRQNFGHSMALESGNAWGRRSDRGNGSKIMSQSRLSGGNHTAVEMTRSETDPKKGETLANNLC